MMKHRTNSFPLNMVIVVDSLEGYYLNTHVHQSYFAFTNIFGLLKPNNIGREHYCCGPASNILHLLSQRLSSFLLSCP